jgi:uncharacterized membrane protein YdcZ (DUF606 family)
LSATRKEILLLVVLPLVGAVAMSVGAAFEVADGGSSAPVVVSVCGAVGLLGMSTLIILAGRKAPQAVGERRRLPWYFTPGLVAVIALSSAGSSLGHTAEGCMLALFAGVLYAFAAWCAARLQRRSKSTFSSTG